MSGIENLGGLDFANKTQQPNNKPSGNKSPQEEAQSSSTAQFNAMFGIMGCAGDTSEDLPFIKKAFESLADEINRQSANSLKLELYILNDQQLAVPLVIVFTRQGNNKLRYVALMLSHLQRFDPPDVVYNVSTPNQISLPRTTYCFWTEFVESTVTSVLSREFLTAGAKHDIKHIGTIVSNKSLSYKTVEESRNVMNHISVLLSSAARIERNEQTVMYNLDQLANAGYRPLVRPISLASHTAMSSMGRPIGCDFALEYVAQIINNRNNINEDINSRQREAVLATVRCAIDFISVDSKEERVGPNGHTTRPGIMPIFIIRDTSSAGNGAVITDSVMSIIMSLIMTKLVSENSALWSRIFEPGQTNQDIGYLGLLNNPFNNPDLLMDKVEIIPSNSKGTRVGTTVNDMVTAYCSATPMIAIDSLDGGPLEPFYKILFDPSSVDYICQEIDFYVGERNAKASPMKFSEYWKSASNSQGIGLIPIMDRNPDFSVAATMYEGYFSSDTGKHDINEVNMLRLMSFDISPAEITNYMLSRVPAPGASNNSVIRDNADTDTTMANKIGFIKNFILGHEITGTSTRRFVNPEWIALVGAFFEYKGISLCVDDSLIVRQNVYGVNRQYYGDGGKTNIFRGGQNSPLGGGIGVATVYNRGGGFLRR